MPLEKPGQIITFYSYKGGTGRSMTLANVACLLAQREKAASVLMIDWDMEAPGLHRYFQGRVSRAFPIAATRENDFNAQPGLIDLFVELRQAAADFDPNDEPEAETIDALFDRLDFSRYIVPTDIPALHLLKAGRFDETYAGRVNGFQWDSLFEQSPWLFPALAGWLSRHYEYVLVDSRTGITDTSGICTMLLPEKLVVVFTPNRQSLTGIIDSLVPQALAYRRNSDDLRPLVVYPLPSRIELAENDLRLIWREGDPTQGIEGYQPAFERLFTQVYNLPECDLQQYFDKVQIQHVPRYAYGEQIAVLAESRTDRLSLAQAYEAFLQRLLSPIGPWEIVVTPELRTLARRFQETETRVRELRDQYRDGQLDRETFEAELRQLMILDDDNTWWMMGVETDKWYRFQGNEWEPATPLALRFVGESAAQSALQAGETLPKEETGTSPALPYLDSGTTVGSAPYLDPAEYARRQLERLSEDEAALPSTFPSAQRQPSLDEATVPAYGEHPYTDAPPAYDTGPWHAPTSPRSAARQAGPRANRLRLALVAAGVILVGIVALVLLNRASVQNSELGQTATAVVAVNQTIEAQLAASQTAFAQATDTSTPTTTGTPTRTTTPTDTPTPTPATPIVQPARSIAARSGPGAQYPIVATLGAESIFPIVGISEDGAWYNILLPDAALAWIANSGALVNAYGDLRDVPLAFAPTDTPTWTPTPTPNSTATPTSTTIPTDTVTPTPDLRGTLEAASTVSPSETFTLDLGFDLYLLMEADLFTVFIVSPRPVALDRFSLRVVNETGEPQIIQVANDFDVLALTGSMGDPGACFVYRFVGSSAPLPAVCDDMQKVFRRDVTPADAFWVNSTAGQLRSVAVYWDSEYVNICPGLTGQGCWVNLPPGADIRRPAATSTPPASG
ncbi:MAG: hypothetical protein HXY41_11340 [Chloroflexi bacterium]|nr:hypothetical protein [Chloroflexota bacterium]